LRIVESFQTAPAAPLLPAGMPFQEPSARKAVLTRPNITVRTPKSRPILDKPEPLTFAQSGPLLPAELTGVVRKAPLVEPRIVPKRRSIPDGWSRR